MGHGQLEGLKKSFVELLLSFYKLQQSQRFAPTSLADGASVNSLPLEYNATVLP